VSEKYKIDEVKQMMKDMLITKDGEAPNVDYLVDMIESCSKDDNRKRQREGLSIIKPKSNKLTFKKRRDFKMIFDDDKIKVGLSAVERGIYDLLCTGVDKSGSSMVTMVDDDTLIDSNRKLFKYLKIGYTKGKVALQTLIDRNLVQAKVFGNRTVYYVNPLYHRYGNEIDKQLKEMFNISNEEFE